MWYWLDCIASCCRILYDVAFYSLIAFGWSHCFIRLVISTAVFSIILGSKWSTVLLWSLLLLYFFGFSYVIIIFVTFACVHKAQRAHQNIRTAKKGNGNK